MPGVTLMSALTGLSAIRSSSVSSSIESRTIRPTPASTACLNSSLDLLLPWRTIRSGGMPPERIVLHGNNKSSEELRQAVDAGVGRIVLDSIDELTELDRIADKPVKALIRVTPGIEAHTH